MRRLKAGAGARGLALLLSATLPLGGCRLTAAPDPRPGRPEFEAPGRIEVPGGIYGIASRNLMLFRRDLSVDTRVRSDLSVDATYNSATRRWHWGHEASYDGDTFVDPEGGRHEVSELADGLAIPGSHWVRVDSRRIKTKGGLVLEFDDEGRLAASYWLSDPHPRLTWTRLPSRIELRECPAEGLPPEGCRLVYSFELGPSGPVRVVDEESAKVGNVREVRYAWAGGRLVGARSAFEVEHGLPGTRYEYATGGLVTAQTSSEDERIEYQWLFGWLWRIAQAGEGGPSHLFSYPAALAGAAGSYRVVHTGPLGGRTRYTFTGDGRVLAVERLDVGESLRIVWDAARRRPLEVRGFDGALRRYEDWQDDDPGRVIEPSGNVVTFAYESDGVDRRHPLARPLSSVDDSLGPVLAIGYDPDGRPERWENGEGEAVTAVHLAGEVASRHAPWGASTEFLSRGVHGHWRSARLSSAPERTVHRKLDRVGNLRVPAAGLQPGGLLERAYDPDRRLAGIALAGADAEGALTTTGAVAIERRSDGQLLAISRPHGADHWFGYDALGRLVLLRERVDGAWVDTHYEYDAAGNPTRIERPNGCSEERDYDVYGRLVERRLLRDGALEAWARFEHAQGRLDRWYDSVRDQWEIFEYDAAGRPQRVVYSALGESLALAYDLRSRTIRQTFALGGLSRVIETEWDLANRRTRVSTRDANGLLEDLVRPVHADGRLVALEYGNGLRREHLFGPEGRFEGYRTTRLATGEVVEELQLSREQRVGPARLELVSRSETALATTEEVYWLSPGGSLQTDEGLMGARVFRWQARSWIGGVLQHEDERAYAWDERSNPTDDPDGDLFAYNSERNRLLSATVDGVGHSYAYDEAGFVIARDALELAWSAGGQLARVGPASSPLARAEWDSLGRPVRIEVLSQSRELALFGGQVAIDLGSGSPGWLHLAHVSLPFAGEARSYRHLDALGNVGVLTDELGEVTSHRRYRPFGLDRVYGSEGASDGQQTGFARGTELRFGGVTTGLVLLGARVLDSDVGRFLSQDPLLQPVSQYAYALGNPVQYEDAEGTTPIGKPPVSAAQLEWSAARASLEAARLDLAVADFTHKAAVFAAAGLVSGAAPLLVLGALVGVFAGSLATQAARLRVEAAGLRAQAAAVRAVQQAAIGGRHEPPPPDLQMRKELILMPETGPSRLGLDVPSLVPELAPPPVCGPGSRGGGSAPRASPLLLALVLLLGLLWVCPRERPRSACV